MNIQSLLSVAVLFYTITNTESTAIEQLHVSSDECGDYKIHHVNEMDIYEIVWNSEKIPLYCKFGFIGRGDDVLDGYKVCVEATEYDLTDCNVKLNYYFGFSYKPDKAYSCNGSPPKSCAGKEEFFDIELTQNSSRPSAYTYTGANFKLVVTAVKVYDHQDQTGLIVGIVFGVIGGIVLLVIIAVVVSIYICNQQTRSHGRGHVFSTGQTNMGFASVTVLNTNQPVATPHPTQAYPTSAYPQQSYPTQSYPTQQYGTVQPVPQASVPPPYNAGPNDLQEKS